MKPSFSSTERKTQRQNIKSVAAPRLGRKRWNITEDLDSTHAGSCVRAMESPSRRRLLDTRKPKSAQKAMKQKSVKTCQARPAIMILAPTRKRSTSSPVNAPPHIPPPMACKIKAMISQGMN